MPSLRIDDNGIDGSSASNGIEAGEGGGCWKDLGGKGNEVVDDTVLERDDEVGIRN